MRKVVLTENKNILVFDPLLQNRGLTLQANEYVELVVTYRDRYQKPIFNSRLMWTVIEDGAILSQPTTLTDGKGQGINRIKVKLDNPKESATVHLLIWPLDEPEARLEFECDFGAPKKVPVTDGDVLVTVFPRRGIHINDPLPTGDPQNSIKNEIHILLCDKYGDRIQTDELKFAIIDTPEPIFQIDPYPEGDHLYHSLDEAPYQGELYRGLELFYESLHSQQIAVFAKDGRPVAQVNNFWPPSGPILKSGSNYTLKALYTDGVGNPLANREISWTQVDSSLYLPGIIIDPPTAKTDSYGVATTTLRSNYEASGKFGSFQLKVSAVGETESSVLAFDYPRFSMADDPYVESFSPSSGVLVFGTPIDFSGIVYVPSDLTELGITWTVLGDGKRYFYFENPYTTTNSLGSISNTMSCLNAPQGHMEEGFVQLEFSPGGSWSASYRFETRIIQLVSPLGEDPFPVGEDVEIEVMLYAADGKTIQPNQDLIIEYDKDLLSVKVDRQTTNSNGVAKFVVNAKKTCSTSVSISEPHGPIGTPVQLAFGKSNVTLEFPFPLSVRYDMWIDITAKYEDKNGDLTPDMELTWTTSNGDTELEFKTSKTGPGGIARNRILCETLTGYPESPVSTYITVTATDGATSGKQLLTFAGSGTRNKIKLISPPEADHVVGQEFTVVVQLLNGLDHPMQNYDINWLEIYGDATVTQVDPYTDKNGRASAKIMGTSVGTPWFVPDVPKAQAHDIFSYRMIDQAPLPDYTLFYNSIFARNLPYVEHHGPNIPTDDREVVTVYYRYLQNNVPQRNQEVAWTVTPSVSDMYVYNKDLTELKNPNGYFVTTTDDEGIAIIKVGSMVPFLTTLHAHPRAHPSVPAKSVKIVMATFDAETNIDESLGYAVADPDPVHVPDRITAHNSGFKLRIPSSPWVDGVSTIFWFRSGKTPEDAEERAIIVPMDDSIQGVDIPYGYVRSNTNSKTTINYISYMLSRNTSSASIIAPPFDLEVNGSLIQNYPDYEITDRPLDKPELWENATTIGLNNITGGLDVIIPAPTKEPFWHIGNPLTVKLYLNGENTYGQQKGDTIVWDYVISSDDIKEGQIIYTAEEERLAGYRYGHFEADYCVNEVWSEILEGITLDTAV